MEKFVSELLRIEIDDEKRTFNGFSSSDAYTEYLNDLFAKASLNGLDSDIYRNAIRIKLQDLDLLLTIHLPHADDVNSILRDYQTNPLLKHDVEWYKMLFSIRGIKEYYAQKVLEMLNLKVETAETIEQPRIEETEDEWISYADLIKRYNFPGVTRVKDAKWRKKHNFYPCHQDGAGCALRISVTEIEQWLKEREKE